MRPLRIVRWYWKLLYLVVSAIIVYLVAVFGDPGHGGDALRGILRSVAILVLTLIAVRIFRGRDEDVALPRTWWRATGGWLAGLFLGVIWFLVGAGSLGVAVGQAGSIATAGTVQAGGVLGFVGIVLAFLYLDSSIRLLLLRRRAAHEAAEEAP